MRDLRRHTADLCEGLCARQFAVALLHLAFKAFAVGDVLLHRQEVGDAPLLVTQCGDGRRLPVELSVLATVVELAAPFVARIDGFP